MPFWNQEKWPERRWIYPLLLAVLVAANIWGQYDLWFGKQGFLRWQQIESQLIDLKKEVAVVENRVNMLKQKIRGVEKEPAILEEVARKELGFVHPGEIIFVFPEQEKQEEIGNSNN
ncbi:FtsB family cell division protein [Magnetococcales bacterium HHB-1]